jgi:quercetin dioxygenase-like cupin family protein
MLAVNFDELPWESPVPGARFKSFSRDGKILRLVEFTNEFVESHWCEKGHIGVVLSGELEIDFKGKVVRYPEGTAIFIPAGTDHGHKGRSVSPLVRLFLVEEA